MPWAASARSFCAGRKWPVASWASGRIQADNEVELQWREIGACDQSSTLADGTAGVICRVQGNQGRRVSHRDWNRDQPPAGCQVLCSHPVGEQTEVTDAHEA